MRSLDGKPSAARDLIRRGEWTKHTAGACPGYTQANLVVLPVDLALEFLIFCQRNPRPCPVLDVTEPGSPHPRMVAPEADLRTDLPRYRVWRRGELVAEVTDILAYWRDDLVSFLLGCSYTFDSTLRATDLPVRHEEEDCVAPSYITNIQCLPAGRFHGPVVVSMRPMTPAQAIRACQVTSRFAGAHGAPIHIGDPAAIGIDDLARVDYGGVVTIHPGEIPVFWACGITPQAVAQEVRPEFMITHAPGHMFITDVKDAQLAVI